MYCRLYIKEYMHSCIHPMQGVLILPQFTPPSFLMTTLPQPFSSLRCELQVPNYLHEPWWMYLSILISTKTYIHFLQYFPLLLQLLGHGHPPSTFLFPIIHPFPQTASPSFYSLCTHVHTSQVLVHVCMYMYVHYSFFSLSQAPPYLVLTRTRYLRTISVTYIRLYIRMGSYIYIGQICILHMQICRNNINAENYQLFMGWERRMSALCLCVYAGLSAALHMAPSWPKYAPYPLYSTLHFKLSVSLQASSALSNTR